VNEVLMPTKPTPDGAPSSEPSSARGSTREQILRATLRVIGEHGVEAVSNRRIAKEAGVALGSLTYHFPSQNELLRETLLLYVHEEVERLSSIAAALRAAEPTLAEIAVEIARIAGGSEFAPEQIAELELHLQAARDPELQDASRRCFAAYDDFAAAALQALNVPDPAKHARTVVAVMGGFALRRLGTGERDASGTADALMTIVRGVGAAPPD
jgi:DNA-binding transcriptional regulator YbjK